MVQEQKKITQKAVAEWLGINPMHYSQFIRNKCGISIGKLQNITRLTGMSAEDIFLFRGKTSRALHMMFRDAYRRRTQS